jgi:hypothetical protein
MDPEVLLAEIKKQGNKILGDTQSDHDAVCFAESVENLLEWLAKGGFAPDWTRYNA